MGWRLAWAGQVEAGATPTLTHRVMHLEQSSVSRPTRHRLAWLSRIAAVSEPRFQNQLVNIPCNAADI